MERGLGLQRAEVLIEEVRALRPRIEKLIGTGNACLESGIALEPECFWPYAGYLDGNFYADHMSHQVGFVKEMNEGYGIKYLGISGGSVYGPHDLRTDGIEVFGVDERNGARIEANVRDIDRFLTLFGKFEDEFYKYVDKKVAMTLGDKLEDARNRASEIKTKENHIDFGKVCQVSLP